MFSLLMAFWMPFAFAQERAQVKSFTPQGFVKAAEQVRIEFSQPMVRFGDIKLDFPAQSECFKKGQGRWVDTKNWVFDFNEPLPGGVSCVVKVLDKTFAFNSGGPHVNETFPRLYRGMEPDQNFVLMLDAPAKMSTVAQSAYFVVEGLGDRIGSLVVEGSEAEKIKEAALKEYKYEKDSFKGDFIVLRAQRNFPPGARVSLIWSKGIQSQSGVSSPKDEVLEFTVNQPFKAEFSCDREAPGKPCIPLLNMHLTFSAPLNLEDAKNIYLQGPDKKRIFASNLLEDANQEKIAYLIFKGPFATNTEYKLSIPKSLKDEDGRALTNQAQFPLTVTTGDNPSLLKFGASFGILEAGSEANLAVTVRKVEKNIETKLVGWAGKFEASHFKDLLQVLNEVQKNPYDSKKLTMLQKFSPQEIQVQKNLKASDTEVLGIPFQKTGFYAVEMESPLLGQSLLNKKAPYFVRTSALVTNMSVHVKHTNQEAWVWVTNLKKAQPIPGAVVKIFDVTGTEVAQGKTDLRGLAFIEFKKPVSDWPRRNEGYYYDGFFAVAEKEGDFSFTHTSWNKGIESWRYQLGMGEFGSAYIGHAILDRVLFKPEEALSAKVLLRKSQGKTLSFPTDKEWPGILLLEHDSGLQSFKLPLQWNKTQGTALIKWPFPPGIKMGHWNMTLQQSESAAPIFVGDFSIESFRVPLIQVRMNSPTPFFVNEKNIPLQATAQYFSGGPASQLPMKFRWSVEPGVFNPQNEEWQEFSFANGGVKEGIYRAGEDEGARYIPQSGLQEIQLDSKGAFALSLKNLKYGTGPQRLRTEVEYKDPNGEIQNVVRSYFLWPSSVVLGIKTKSWWATPESVEFEVVALDLMQNSLANQRVQVDLYTSRYYSHRKRLVGGFYDYEDYREYRKIGELCRGETNSQGTFACRGQSKVTGSVLAVVSAVDSDGRKSFANVNQWIVKPGESMWFGGDDNDRADLIPFKRKYEPGDVAEFQLRTPFPEAKVLVTVERDSVLSTEVIDVKGDRPVIRVPIKKEYAPNVVVSAFAIRGRLSSPEATALVDLAKPAFKLGLANIRVGWKENTLSVQVKTEKKQFKAREKAKVTVAVKDSQGRPASQGEIALVAVDEGLLELRDNDSWDLLKSMMRQRPHLVETATAQTWVIGKRHFGLKALPIGGDGGGGLRRELFDTLLYWNPSLKLDGRGEAQVEIPLNDLTTSFRIVAVAQRGADQFGTGWTAIQSSKDVMILPGLAGFSREGDSYLAGFTVRNASSVNQNLDLTLKTNIGGSSYTPQNLNLKAGEAREIFWKIEKVQAPLLDFVVTAKNPQGQIVDEIKKTQKVLPLRTARIYQSEWGLWPDFKKISLKRPEAADPQKSSLVMEVSAGPSTSRKGIEEFWRNYSYNCLEQEVSRAVSLNDKKLWDKIQEKISTYMDHQGLLRYFPTSQARGSVILSAYVLSVAHEAGFHLSEDNENKMLEAMNAYVQGRLREEVDYNRADETLKKVAAMEALSRYRRLNVDLLTSIDFAPTQWPLYSLVEWYQIHLWEKNIPLRDKKLMEIEDALRSRFYFSAKRLQVREEQREFMPWLMRDSEGSILRLILATSDLPKWKEDSLRLYQGVMSKQTRGAWMLTSDNAWGVLVSRKVQKNFAKDKVQGLFAWSMEGQTKQHDWSQSSMAVMELPWREKQSQVQWEQKGSGSPWVTVSAKYALPIKEAQFAGFSFKKTIIPVEQKKKGVWSVGDVVKIQLKVTPKAPQTWVVVEDSIPAGSSVMTNSWATAVEKKEDVIRYYFSWFSGEENIEYTIRFNQAGTFQLPSPHVEAMYSPDLFANLPEEVWTVEP